MQATIILGSKSDRLIADKVKEVLEEFDIEYEIRVASAHRTPELVKEIVEKSNAEVFIAIAGLSAALPGAVASLTIKPVIGVPVSGKLNIDSILSIAQMPPGIAVATVGLDNGTNAGLLAVQMLALKDKKLQEKFIDSRKKMKEKILKDDEEVRKI
ncbi:5-(carboxyamino)imidazole ribonucleotide mutase [bacterium]|nr:5-(carboxyamino)imidazole ribonucleotide mutase [bacterium]MBU1153865.1 5-(carboxyamino)imidazole ribonucleotide mutase [bacterium]